MKRKRGGLSKKEDKISKLPDELIHHILSFIDMKYAVRTCVLSKRWRYIWTSLQTLNFDSSLYGNYRKAINKVLKGRNNEVYDIQRFHFNYYAYTFHQSSDRASSNPRVHHAVFNPNIEDVSISKVCRGFPVNHLFTCKSLKRLALEGDYVNLPKSIYLPRLVYLKLHNLPLEEENLSKLISSCPVLEDLELSNPRFLNISIHSTTLKNLKIRKDTDTGIITGRITLSVYAPNLVSFDCKSATNDIALENVSSIVDAVIDTEANTYYGAHPKAYPRYMLKCLKSLGNVKYLTISAAPLQSMAKAPDFLENQVSEFRNLQCLTLLHTDFSSSSSIYVIAAFLKITLNIESLTLRATSFPDSDSDSSESHTADSESDCPGLDSSKIKMISDLEKLSTTFTLNKLKIFEMSQFQGGDVEMKLVEILLRKANVLEKLNLYRSGIYDDILGKKIEAFPRASPSFVLSTKNNNFHMHRQS